eukprot:CAMPEP_0180216050 /NCGR_PEP_ID=MMETSP0987-20121128/15920_1 /TAXON_ID=697907 /ORGANISM="non described non described, Strain CCMP2293" /LENGTH=74 /DNA_ID=CAMNT_0022174945 /DNA_START=546 /DNA_END=768 /DNA_ORIENTATION=+
MRKAGERRGHPRAPSAPATAPPLLVGSALWGVANLRPRLARLRALRGLALLAAQQNLGRRDLALPLPLVSIHFL